MFPRQCSGSICVQRTCSELEHRELDKQRKRRKTPGKFKLMETVNRQLEPKNKQIYSVTRLDLGIFCDPTGRTVTFLERRKLQTNVDEKFSTTVNTKQTFTCSIYLSIYLCLSGLCRISCTVGCSDKKRTARITNRSLLNVDRQHYLSSFAYIRRQLSLELKNSTYKISLSVLTILPGGHPVVLSEKETNYLNRPWRSLTIGKTHRIFA